MPIEIERKFLVCSDEWRHLATRKVHICQGYLGIDCGFSTRIRVVDNSRSTLTVKSSRAGLRRLEFEYPIPLPDAQQLLSLRQVAVIKKVRHFVARHGLTWEIDVFEGDNAGLVVAEIELDHETRPFEMPRWIGAEITGQTRYYNSSLVRHPFRLWAAGAPMHAIEERKQSRPLSA
jgi:adenylate cyclase